MKFKSKLVAILSSLSIGLTFFGCNAGKHSSEPKGETSPSTATITEGQQNASVASQDQERQIRSLIEQLVFADTPATDDPPLTPGLDNLIEKSQTRVNGENNAEPDEVSHSVTTEEYRKRFEECAKAYQKLLDYKEAAFPFLVEHLDDERQSIPFRNHYPHASVGDACYWNIYHQLQDRPKDYSKYGYMREGRGGKDHEKPYWDATPFDEDDGLKAWLEKNKALTYTQMQIKCLQWLLERETKIGASDAESYFVNILPLEIHICERRLEMGEDVREELARLIQVRNEKNENAIPSGLLPDAK